MEVNYLGSVYPTRAVITTMKERRMGRIMFVSSQAGQIGLFGYTAYSPSKFALRGLAESLQMEVQYERWEVFVWKYFQFKYCEKDSEFHTKLLTTIKANKLICKYFLTADKAIQHLCNCGVPSWHWHSRTGWGEQDKGKHLFKTV